MEFQCVKSISLVCTLQDLTEACLGVRGGRVTPALPWASLAAAFLIPQRFNIFLKLSLTVKVNCCFLMQTLSAVVSGSGTRRKQREGYLRVPPLVRYLLLLSLCTVTATSTTELWPFKATDSSTAALFYTRPDTR